MSTPKFKIGDRVRILPGEHSSQSRYIGLPPQIAWAEKEGVPCRVQNIRNDDWMVAYVVSIPSLEPETFVFAEHELGGFEKSSVLPDTGARTNFETGAVRDASSGKGLPSSIPPVAIRKLAKRFEDGAAKYSRDNWMKGIPLSRYQDSLMRHTLAAAEGKTDEDHLGAVLWNAAAWAWTEEAIASGKLPATLNDLPFRQ